MVVFTLTFHRMKNLHTGFVNYIIQNFQQIAILIEAQQQMFVGLIRKNIVIVKIEDGVGNILPAYIMPERTLGELNDDFIHNWGI
jgi:hypothetical protein